MEATRPSFQSLILLSVFAALTLLPLGAEAATLQSVQSGTTTSSGNGSVFVNISPVDPAKSFLLFQTRHDSKRPPGSMIRGRIASPGTLEFVRVTAETSTMTIQWYVVEYSSGVSVQRGEVAQSATTVDVTLPGAVTALDQAFVTWSKTPLGSETGFGEDDAVLADLTTTSNLQFRTDEPDPGHIIWWQVTEFTDAADINVQRGSITSMGRSNSSVTATLSPPMDPSKTFVLVSYRTSGSGADIGERMLRAVLTNSTTITIDRSITGDDITEIAWQAIELTDGSTVQGGSQSFASGVGQETASISGVDLSRSVAFASVQLGGGQNVGRSALSGDDIVGVGSVTMDLSSSTQVTMDRNNTDESTDVGWFVVEFGSADADLAVTKSVDDATPNEGGTVVYTVVATNDGSTGATGVELTDLLPAGLTISSSTTTAGSYVEGTGVWTLGALAAFGSETLTIVASVDAGFGGSTITNTASLTASDQADPNPANDSDAADVFVQSISSDEMQVTSDPGVDSRPSWAPDETQIAFDSDRGGNPDVWVVPSAGGTAAQLTTQALLDRHADWSPDGTQIVYSSREGGAPLADLRLIAPTGGASTLLASDATKTDRFPAWSADGTQVAYVKGGDIYVVASTGGTPVRVTTHPMPDSHPTWSPDGSTIAFVSTRGGGSDIWLVPLTGGVATQLTSDPGVQGAHAPDWSPDGSRITFQSDRGGSEDVWVVSVDTGMTNRITTSPADDTQPDWSPTGDRIAFARDGNLWIFSAPVDLTVAVSVDDPSPAQGATVDYTIVLGNDGPKGATGVGIAAMLPVGLTFQSATATQGSYDSGTGIWSAGSIAFGATETLTLTASVDFGTAGATLVHTASVTASEQLDAMVANSSDSAPLTVAPILAMSSSADQFFLVGDPSTAISPIKVVEDGVTPTITATDDLRIRIPLGVDMTWDTGDLTASITGPAAGKVASQVTYEDGGSTLVLDVTSDFSAADQIVVSDLAFASFGSPSAPGNLELEVNDDGVVSVLDDSTIEIVSVTPAAVVAFVPATYSLDTSRPNPFRAQTSIQFDLPTAGMTSLVIYDVQGRLVKTLVREPREAGRYSPVWDGRDRAGRRVAAGVYFVRLESGSFDATKKVIRLR